MTATFVLDTLIESALRAAAIAAMVAIVLGAFRIKAAAVRHATWTGVLATMLVLPLVSGWLPTVPLPVSAPDFTWPAEADQHTNGTDGEAGPAQVAAATQVQPGTASSRPSRALVTPSPIGSLRALSVAIPEAAWSLRAWLVLAWAAGAGLMLLREAVGWWAVRRLARQSVRVPSTDDAETYQSSRVTTPVVAGVLAPRVLVPESWSRWGADVRRMVVLHEHAHVTRRDPLIASLARINRAVFWFHPLAWWLERHLARVAELACDDVVVGQVANPRVYAALLLEMARRLQRSGQRVAWQGIGIVSAQRLEDRIDLVLRGPVPAMPMLARVSLGIACAALLLIGVACGTSAAPLAEDPDLAKDIASREARLKDFQAGGSTKASDLPGLEKAVADNPSDMAATRRLVAFYQRHGQPVLGWDRMIAASRPHKLRLIADDAEAEQPPYWGVARRFDPEGYAQARELWVALAARPGASSLVIANTAAFLSWDEPFEAEKMLLRGKAMAGTMPSSLADGSRRVTRLSWSSRLGLLYAQWLMSTHPEAGDFQRHARQVLASTKDDRMLAAAASHFPVLFPVRAGTPDHRAEARRYAEAALALNPKSTASYVLSRLEEDSSYNRMMAELGGPAHEVTDVVYEGLSDDVKLKHAHGLMWGPYGHLMVAYQRNDKAAITASLASFEKRASDMLLVATRAAQTAAIPPVIADGHIALGTVAMRHGSTGAAVDHLKMAATAARATAGANGVVHAGADLRAIDVLRTLDARFIRDAIATAAWKLTYELLSAGERESVADFYDAAAKGFGSQQRAEFELAAANVRLGKMPALYQRHLARTK